MMKKRQFKSYYVVWKRYLVTKISPGAKSFKSYYVVWKLHITLTISHTENGLNRTMQYGNNIYPETKIQIFFRLNRTMQYGNKMSQQTNIKELELFKSYYVVWKPIYIHKKKMTVKSLNRTMQYGNKIE